MTDIKRQPLAMTMGDPAGIGPELALRAWLRRAEIGAPFFVIADPVGLRELAQRLALTPPLPVVPVTIHIPPAAAPAALTKELIVSTARIVAVDMAKRFGVPRPRLAVAGLNPHAGEGGAIGREEIDVIAPAIAELRAGGIDV